jgi:hypothetical protein
MTFLVLPWPAEAVFWLSSVPTSISVVLMLAAMHLAVGWARGAGGWWLVGTSAALCFAACCLNEQPAMLCGAMPMVVVCAAGRVDRGVAVRAAAMLAAGVCAVSVYTVFHVAHAPNAMDIGAGRGDHSSGPVAGSDAGAG